jgi:hypothetical protein
MFDRKLLMHAMNAITGLFDEIRTVSAEILLQRLATVPLEKLFGITRLHAKTHQTMTGILKTMEINQAMRFVYAYHDVKNRRRSSGKTVARGECKYVIQPEPILFSGPF